MAQTVVAPIAGTVTGLNVKAGQTVSSQSVALTVVPGDVMFHAELLVPGRSVGLLETGLELRLRFEAYPYDRYGLYAARIVSIARSPTLPGDAQFPVALLKPVYRVRAALDRQHVTVAGRPRALVPGMALQADILLEERTLLEWMMRPLHGVTKRL